MANNSSWQPDSPLTFATASAMMTEGRKQVLAAKNEQSLIFDFKDIPACDSASMALLIDWLRFARSQQIELKFKHIPAKMRSLIQVSELEELIKNDLLDEC